MGVIVNYWLRWTADIEANVNGVLPIIKDRNPREEAEISVFSVEFPLLNTMREDTMAMMRQFPGRYNSAWPTGLWNCLARADGLHELTAMREDLQQISDYYPDNFQVVGCWDFYTGEPVGGVGSPWFPTPPSLADLMPPVYKEVPQTEFPPTNPRPELFGVLHDIVLVAGQAPRKFV